MAVAVALAILAIIPLVADAVRADLGEIVARNYPRDTDAVRGRAVIAVLVTLSGVGLLLAALVTAFAFALRAGRRAARMALAALAALAAPYATVTFQAVPPAAKAVPPVTAALAVAAAVAMSLPASNAWFARR